MKNYYLIEKSALEGDTQDEFNGSLEHHWIDLQNGHAVVVAKFRDEGAAKRFSSHPSVTKLPHLLSMKTLQEHHPEHHPKLSKIFPSIQPTHRTLDVAEEIAKHHDAFSPEVF